MDMSVDEQRNLVSAAEKPSSSDSKAAEDRSVHASDSCLTGAEKQASLCDLMEGSFRDELRNRHGDIIPSTTNSVSSSAVNVEATVDSTKSVSVSTEPSEPAGLVNKNCVKDDKSAKSRGFVDSKLNAHYKAPVSFSDVSKSASVSADGSSTSQINDSFAYRNQSVILVSDDDDSGTGSDCDKRDDKIKDWHPINSGTETAASKQKPTTEPLTNDFSSKPFPQSKPQSTDCEVSTSKVCKPSTIITLRPPVNTSVQTVDGLSSAVDVEQMMAKRDNVSKLLDQKKVYAIDILTRYIFG